MKRFCFNVLVLAAAFFLMSCEKRSVLLQEEKTAASAMTGSSVGSDADEAQQNGSDSESVAMITVHVCGCVMNPGVYEAEKGSRVYQLIELAGGFAPGAAEEYLNLARLVSDGEKLVIPSLEEVGDSPYGTEEESADDELVNINTADKDRLMTLPGIGEARALAIIAWRTEHGPFQTIEEIMQVSGIKEAAFEKIKSRITVG